MNKIHTRIKRKKGLTTSFRHRFFFGNIKKANRPKTFSTEGAANEAAKKLGLAEGNYSLIKVKKGKRFQIFTE